MSALHTSAPVTQTVHTSSSSTPASTTLGLQPDSTTPRTITYLNASDYESSSSADVLNDFAAAVASTQAARANLIPMATPPIPRRNSHQQEQEHLCQHEQEQTPSLSIPTSSTATTSSLSSSSTALAETSLPSIAQRRKSSPLNLSLDSADCNSNAHNNTNLIATSKPPTSYDFSFRFMPKSSITTTTVSTASKSINKNIDSSSTTATTTSILPNEPLKIPHSSARPISNSTLSPDSSPPSLSAGSSLSSSLSPSSRPGLSPALLPADVSPCNTNSSANIINPNLLPSSDHISRSRGSSFGLEQHLLPTCTPTGATTTTIATTPTSSSSSSSASNRNSSSSNRESFSHSASHIQPQPKREQQQQQHQQRQSKHASFPRSTSQESRHQSYHSSNSGSHPSSFRSSLLRSLDSSKSFSASGPSNPEVTQRDVEILFRPNRERAKTFSTALANSDVDPITDPAYNVNDTIAQNNDADAFSSASDHPAPGPASGLVAASLSTSSSHQKKSTHRKHSRNLSTSTTNAGKQTEDAIDVLGKIMSSMSSSRSRTDSTYSAKPSTSTASSRLYSFNDAFSSVSSPTATLESSSKTDEDLGSAPFDGHAALFASSLTATTPPPTTATSAFNSPLFTPMAGSTGLGINDFDTIRPSDFASLQQQYQNQNQNYGQQQQQQQHQHDLASRYFFDSSQPADVPVQTPYDAPENDATDPDQSPIYVALSNPNASPYLRQAWQEAKVVLIPPNRLLPDQVFEFLNSDLLFSTQQQQCEQQQQNQDVPVDPCITNIERFIALHALVPHPLYAERLVGYGSTFDGTKIEARLDVEHNQVIISTRYIIDLSANKERTANPDRNSISSLQFNSSPNSPMVHRRIDSKDEESNNNNHNNQRPATMMSKFEPSSRRLSTSSFATTHQQQQSTSYSSSFLNFERPPSRPKVSSIKQPNPEIPPEDSKLTFNVDNNAKSTIQFPSSKLYNPSEIIPLPTSSQIPPTPRRFRTSSSKPLPHSVHNNNNNNVNNNNSNNNNNNPSNIKNTNTTTNINNNSNNNSDTNNNKSQTLERQARRNSLTKIENSSKLTSSSSPLSDLRETRPIPMPTSMSTSSAAPIPSAPISPSKPLTMSSSQISSSPLAAAAANSNSEIQSSSPSSFIFPPARSSLHQQRSNSPLANPASSSPFRKKPTMKPLKILEETTVYRRVSLTAANSSPSTPLLPSSALPSTSQQYPHHLHQNSPSLHSVPSTSSNLRHSSVSSDISALSKKSPQGTDNNNSDPSINTKLRQKKDKLKFKPPKWLRFKLKDKEKPKDTNEKDSLKNKESSNTQPGSDYHPRQTSEDSQGSSQLSRTSSIQVPRPESQQLERLRVICVDKTIIDWWDSTLSSPEARRDVFADDETDSTNQLVPSEHMPTPRKRKSSKSEPEDNEDQDSNVNRDDQVFTNPTATPRPPSSSYNSVTNVQRRSSGKASDRPRSGAGPKSQSFSRSSRQSRGYPFPYVPPIWVPVVPATREVVSDISFLLAPPSIVGSLAPRFHQAICLIARLSCDFSSSFVYIKGFEYYTSQRIRKGILDKVWVEVQAELQMEPQGMKLLDHERGRLFSLFENVVMAFLYNGLYVKSLVPIFEQADRSLSDLLLIYHDQIVDPSEFGVGDVLSRVMNFEPALSTITQLFEPGTLATLPKEQEALFYDILRPFEGSDLFPCSRTPPAEQEQETSAPSSSSTSGSAPVSEAASSPFAFNFSTWLIFLINARTPQQICAKVRKGLDEIVQAVKVHDSLSTSWVGTDQLIPMLAFLIARAIPTHLESITFFATHFRLSESMAPDLNWALSTFQAAVSFLKSDPLTLQGCSVNFSSSGNSSEQQIAQQPRSSPQGSPGSPKLSRKSSTVSYTSNSPLTRLTIESLRHSPSSASPAASVRSSPLDPPINSTRPPMERALSADLLIKPRIMLSASSTPGSPSKQGNRVRSSTTEGQEPKQYKKRATRHMASKSTSTIHEFGLLASKNKSRAIPMKQHTVPSSTDSWSSMFTGWRTPFVYEHQKPPYSAASTSDVLQKQQEERRQLDAARFEFGQGQTNYTDDETWWEWGRKRLTSIISIGGVPENATEVLHEQENDEPNMQDNDDPEQGRQEQQEQQRLDHGEIQKRARKNSETAANLLFCRPNEGSNNKKDNDDNKSDSRESRAKKKVEPSVDSFKSFHRTIPSRLDMSTSFNNYTSAPSAAVVQNISSQTSPSPSSPPLSATISLSDSLFSPIQKQQK